MAKIGIIGKGNIGKTLERKVSENGWEIGFTMDSKRIYGPNGKVMTSSKDREIYKSVDLIFLATPTFDDGKVARGYITSADGIPLVTCEKGALGNLPLADNKPFTKLLEEGKIGYSASVGGGTGMLSYTKSKITPGFSGEIHAVVNGTNNFILHGLSQGRSLEEMTEEAIKLGYAEPGAASPYDIIKGEAESDVPLKTAILFNETKLSDEILRADAIKTNSLGRAELKTIVEEAKNLRYIVSITQNGHERGIPIFDHAIGNWNVSAGFRPIDINPYGNLVVPGVNNCIYINKGKDGSFTLSGPGAGPDPTAEVMMDDAKKLLEKFPPKA